MDLRDFVRDVPDFPKKGIIFRDITPLLRDGKALALAVERIAERFSGFGVDVIVGPESRGFLLGAPVAVRLGKGFVPVRKKGKLPGETVSAKYELEYGEDEVEMHRDAISPGEKVLVVDDLLATGGTVSAVKDLVEKSGGEIVGFCFLIELERLGGRKRLKGSEVLSLITY